MFKYFSDPENFSFRIKEEAKCDICSEQGIWFSAGGFTGSSDIDCICDNCLANGALEELEIYSNEAVGGDAKETNIIMHRTPALPTWQDTLWPCVDGEYCVFERIASKEDFLSLSEFRDSLFSHGKENTDIEWLWALMPDIKVKNHIEGNFNVSVYLFTNKGKKYCIWDAS